MSEFSIEQAKMDRWAVEFRCGETEPWRPGQYIGEWHGRTGTTDYSVEDTKSGVVHEVGLGNIRNIFRPEPATLEPATPETEENVVALGLWLWADTQSLGGVYAYDRRESLFNPAARIWSPDDGRTIWAIPRTEVWFRDGVPVAYKQPGREWVEVEPSNWCRQAMDSIRTWMPDGFTGNCVDAVSRIANQRDAARRELAELRDAVRGQMKILRGCGYTGADRTVAAAAIMALCQTETEQKDTTYNAPVTNIVGKQHGSPPPGSDGLPIDGADEIDDAYRERDAARRELAEFKEKVREKVAAVVTGSPAADKVILSGVLALCQPKAEGENDPMEAAMKAAEQGKSWMSVAKPDDAGEGGVQLINGPQAYANWRAAVKANTILEQQLDNLNRELAEIKAKVLGKVGTMRAFYSEGEVFEVDRVYKQLQALCQPKAEEKLLQSELVPVYCSVCKAELSVLQEQETSRFLIEPCRSHLDDFDPACHVKPDDAGEGETHSAAAIVARQNHRIAQLTRSLSDLKALWERADIAQVGLCPAADGRWNIYDCGTCVFWNATTKTWSDTRYDFHDRAAALAALPAALDALEGGE